MTDFINTLRSEFEKNANAGIAAGQKAYMKNQFEYYGIKTPLRRKIQKFFLTKEYLPPKSDLDKIVKTLWSKPQREYQYFAQELAYKYTRQFEKSDVSLFEFMVTHKSWWDTVDFISVKLMGEYFKIYPNQRKKYVKKWIATENMWLQRSAVLFQLNYKAHVDTGLLTFTINSLLGSKEFFINKAIGWMLRSYSKTNSNWVVDFVQKTELENLSRREALRLIQ